MTVTWANDITIGPTTLTAVTCCDCGVTFGVDTRFKAARREDGRWFYCPNGHGQAYNGATQVEKDLARARQQLEYSRAALTHEHDQRVAAEKSRTALKGQLTKIRRRVAAGVCPCCSRTFQDLARHMEGQHPSFDQETHT